MFATGGVSGPRDDTHLDLAVPRTANASQPPQTKKQVGWKRPRKLILCGEKRKADQISSSQRSYECKYHQLAKTQHGEDRTLADPTIAELVSAGTSLDAIKASIYSLENEPHPLFRNIEWEEPAFPGVMTGLGGNDRSFYQDILPALQIASKILVHPDVLPFWHGLFESHRTKHRQGLDYQFSAKCQLTRAEAIKTRLKLAKMAPQISIWSGTLKIHAKRMAWSARLGLQPGDAGYNPKIWTPYGRDCNGTWTTKLPREWRFVFIMLSSDHIETARDWQRPDSEMSVAEVENFYFSLACKLLHEMSHAIVKILWGKVRIYFRNETIQQTGFSFEAFIFGGLVRPLSVDSWKHMRIATWPNAGRYNLYNSALTRKIRGTVQGGMAIRGLLPPQAKTAFLKRGFISLLFNPHFWEVKRKGRAVFKRELRIPKMHAIDAWSLPNPKSDALVSYLSVRRRQLLLPKCCRRMDGWDTPETGNSEGDRPRPTKRIKVRHETDPEMKTSGFGHPISKVVAQARAARLAEKRLLQSLEAWRVTSRE